MAVREPREEVRPRQRARIGVGEVDLHLRHHHEEHGDAEHPGRIAQHVREAREVHLRRLDRMRGRYLVLQCEEREKGAAHHLEHARHDPARPRDQHRGPPAAAVGGGLLGQEAQVVDLLADLHHEREGHRGGRAEHQRIEAAAVGGAAHQAREVGVQLGLFHQHRDEGADEKHDPDRLRPQLQPRDERDAARHQRNDHDGRHEIEQPQRPVEVHLQRQREDGRLQREEDEGEARVDQRGERGAQVAEARAAGEQVHVHAMARRVVRDRQAREKGDEPHHQDGPQRVREAVAQRDRPADGLQRQERGGAERRVGHPELRPLAKAARRVAQRVVLQRFVRDPGVVVAADAKDLLSGDGCHGGFSRRRRWHGQVQQEALPVPLATDGPPMSGSGVCGQGRVRAATLNDVFAGSGTDF
jgi:hypothetical protein